MNIHGDRLASNQIEPQSEVAKLRSQLSVTVEEVTPTMAADWLGGNTKNYRKPRPKNVKCIAGDIQRGEFSFTNATIAFDVDGVLTDGQHRLLAVVEADCPIISIVVRGMPRGAGEDPATDTGSKRSVATHLQNVGIPNAINTAACGRFLYTIKNGLGRPPKISDARLARVVQSNPSIAEAVSRTCCVQGACSQSVAASWLWVAAFDDESLASECITILAGSGECSTKHPFQKLRDAFLSGKVHASVKNGTDMQILSWRYLCSAWARAKKGEKADLIRPLALKHAAVINQDAKDALDLMWGE